MDKDDVLRLLHQPPVLAASDDDIHDAFWRAHPRFRFFKTLPYGARLLDIGAGGGGLAFWRGWQEPARDDIGLFGADLIRGEHADRYEDWWSGDLNADEPQFAVESFEGFNASHIIHQIESLPQLLRYVARAAAPGARVYMEWPGSHTATLPSAREFVEEGFPIQTFNFHDDATNRHSYRIAAVTAMAERAGFRILERGEIQLGVLATELLARGRQRDEASWVQMGLWAAVGWSSYLVAERGPLRKG